MPARTRLVLCSLAAAALVLGCSDDPKIDEDADQDLVEEVTLTLDDLPDGFEEQEEEDDEDDTADAFDECGDEAGIDEDEVDENRVAKAGDDVSFALADDTSFTQIASTVVTFRDAGLARRQLEAFEDDDFFDCVADGAEDEMTDDDEITDFTIDTIDPAVDGDASAALAIDVLSDGIPFELQFHLVVIDRVGITMQVLSGPDGIDDDLVDDAFDAILERLEDEQG